MVVAPGRWVWRGRGRAVWVDKVSRPAELAMTNTLTALDADFIRGDSMRTWQRCNFSACGNDRPYNRQSLDNREIRTCARKRGSTASDAGERYRRR